MQRSVAKNLLKRNVINHRTLPKIALSDKSIAENQYRNTEVVGRFSNSLSVEKLRQLNAISGSTLKLRPFLDNKNMKPGDKLFEKINDAIKGCKIGVLVFSPRYCESYFCLHELALMMETKKKIIPIFCDIKPSELGVINNGCIPHKEVERFNLAVEEAKYTVGLTFNSQDGNWSDVVTNAANIVTQSLMEVEYHEKQI
ncbi:Toll-Interleukin-Resistance (TIR) domain family protein [Abeliophyllum distichum]|uniref:Toll-Interleukin-Resistance (TIR) domain family protein n=1 Tax=Abeliophyllum distichum TaxID=126358 RepID=A0ABD1QIS0_9LAMI